MIEFFPNSLHFQCCGSSNTVKVKWCYILANAYVRIFNHNCSDKYFLCCCTRGKKKTLLKKTLLLVTQVGFSHLFLAWFFYHSLVFASLFVYSFFPPLLKLIFHNPVIFCFHKHFLLFSWSVHLIPFGQIILSIFCFFLQYFPIKDPLTAQTQNTCIFFS